uniref:galactosylxylosylprotein 3-beta-galactosyltransferase n=1 Tax=Megafenestra aurita TaxID=2291010 RepID=A0A4Y7NH77_9CRUS|nr:EOG090X0A8N [Megafenestra aurita]SVE92541.1 EOG090X0A8N [Megafenestra aurita]
MLRGTPTGIWVHVEGDNTPNYNADGYVQSPDVTGSLLGDLKAFLDAAKANNILVTYVLWNGALLRKQQTVNLFWDNAKLQAYIDNALTPMVVHLAGHPALGGWDIINEPEGLVYNNKPDASSCFNTVPIANSGAGWTNLNIPMEHRTSNLKIKKKNRILLFINWQAAAIKAADPDSLTSTKELSKNTGSITKTFVLIILIMSDATKAATRKVLRETWLSTGNEKIKHFFVVGSKGLASEVLENISDENFAFHDMLILNSTSESYTSLTKKVLAGFQWIHSNYNFNFLLKCDDDSFVRISSLLQELEKQPQNLLYWGFFKGGSSVFQKGKWKESEWFLCDTYLPYALGGGYILSSDLIEYLAKSAPLLQQYKSEDVSVGVWLSPLKINRIHDVRFDTEFKSRGCFNDYLITHKQSANDMRIKHNNLFSTGKLCPSELRARYSYNYNWTVPPTKCCKNFDPSLP